MSSALYVLQKFVISPDFSIEAVDMTYLWSIGEGEMYDLEFIKEAAVKVFTSAVLKTSVAKGIKNSKHPGLDPIAREGIRGNFLINIPLIAISLKILTIFILR